jgi:uncharacterized protein (DUF58 family)
MSDLTQYLQPSILAKVDNLELIAKFIVEGFLIGLHRSPYHGFSVEFSSYRKYEPGDELKFIDWRVFGRTDKFYVKQFEETTNLNCYLVMDISGSMEYADRDGRSGGISKLRYASYLNAGLAYMMLRQGDAVGLVGLNAQSFEFVPSSSKSNWLMQLLSRMSQLKAQGETGLGRGLSLLAERIKGRSLIVITSDLLMPPNDLLEALSYFRYKNHEVIVFHVLTDTELKFPFTRQTNFVDMETNKEIITESAYIREEYKRLLGEHVGAMKRACRDVNADFLSLSTSDDLGDALMTYMAKRAEYF